MSTEELLKQTKPKKQKRRHVQTEARKAQQAKFLKRGHPGGRPRQHAEVVAQIRGAADEILGILFTLLRKPELTSSDKIRSLICESLLDRAFGRAPHTLAAAVQHTSLDGTMLHLEGAAMSPLLQQAHAYAASEATQPRSQAIDVTTEPISPPSPPPSVQPFIADPAGNIASVVAGSAAHPDEADAEPAPPPERPTEPAQEAPPHGGTGRPFPGVPGQDEREQEAERERARLVEQARARGQCQIGPEEAFPPDPREPAEVVNFTLAGKGRIRRC